MPKIISIEDSSIAAVITNPRLPDNPIVACNQAFQDLTGYSKDEIIGRNCRFLSESRENVPLQKQIMRAIRDKMPLLCEVVNFKKDGSRFVNSLLIVPIFDDLGELIYFLGSQTEVKAISPEEIHAVNSQSNRLASLSKRQREVLSGMIAGRRNKEIACELGISERTVKMHRAAAIAALNVRTSADAISMAVRAGWPDKRSKA